MSTIQSILLHFDAGAASAPRLHLAHRLAEQHDARVTALYAVRPALMQYPSAAAFSADVGGLMQEFEAERLARAKALFDATASAAGGMPRVAWAQAEGEPARACTRRALAVDLLLLGQHAPGDDGSVPADFVASVVQDSGRPALVLPYIYTDAPIDGVALVAWKETREAARAVSAALPLLQRCTQVLVATWDDGVAGLALDTPVDIVTYLCQHGARAEWHAQGRTSSDVGGDLLSLAADCAAALLVMGCYGHGRAREWVLGGATRTVLQSMTLPVLMAH